MRLRTISSPLFCPSLFLECHPRFILGRVRGHANLAGATNPPPLTLPAELACCWRGTGNQHTDQSPPPAALKLQLRWDLKSGALAGPIVQEGRAADTKSPLTVDELPAGALRIADQGYFHLATFAQLQAQGKYWLSYLKLPLNVYDQHGQRIDLWGMLKRQVQVAQQYQVCLGAQLRLPARLIAVRVPEDLLAERLKEVESRAHHAGREPSEQQKELAAWDLIVTNIPVKVLSLPEVVVLLRAH